MCKHLNINLREYGTSYSDHTFQDGQYVDANSDTGSYSGQISIICHDCGYTCNLSRLNKRLPKWVRKYLAILDTKTKLDSAKP